MKRIMTMLIAMVASLWPRRKLMNAWNGIASGTHTGGKLTRYVEQAVSTRYLLGKKGTTSDLYVDICGADDVPDFIMTDEADTAGDEIGVMALGCGEGTALMVASAAIVMTSVDFLVPAASGKVRALPTSAGTYYVIGKPLEAASGDGELIEVAHCSPSPVTVTE